ncbi:polysaccharide deacetylase family protein [Paenibacillus mendelii]|uniref:Polysaccharide deacetylase family protein n=1 Tax=Paenibacillus mendelii TaxID=206163 RepID=A0ABV6J8E2_9BACL|nr:polysaccharide deacetylase family protein [Paenibacillus mendelii]MCQ6559487.1 polysaccharide deacetylase family protein [Paenibacillus mendelii]
MRPQNVKMLFPEGKTRAFTMSYDDGTVQDRRFVEVLDTYQLKATFNLNSGALGQQDRLQLGDINVDHSHIEPDEVKPLFRNHEVAIHTVTHPDLTKVSDESIRNEVLEDKKALEELVGYPVRGMAYPGGNFSDHVVEVLSGTGVAYSRTVVSHHAFHLPEQFLTWHPTCHDNDPARPALTQKFLDPTNKDLLLFYVWGHGFEFDMYEDAWEKIEAFCSEISGKPEVWYATNIEIYDYVKAVNELRYTEQGTVVYNPSALDVYLEGSGKPIIVKGGATIGLSGEKS